MDELINIKKVCKRCLKEKQITDFIRSANTKYGFGSACKTCMNAECQKYRESKDGKFRYYFNLAKQRNIQFILTEEQFFNIWQKPCKYCGAEIKTIGLDRLDNKLGYTVDNAVPCCIVCNRMKLDLEYDRWISHMKKILSIADKKDK